MLANEGTTTDCNQENEKSIVCSLATSNSSFNSRSPLKNMPQFKKRVSKHFDWQKSQENIMGWFTSKQIFQGSPSEIPLVRGEQKRKQICEIKVRTTVEKGGLLGRRLGRCLTITP